MRKPEHSGPGWQIHNADALTFLQSYDDGEPFDSVIADPPYSSGGATRGDRMTSTTTKYVNSDSGSQRLRDFEGDNRDQRSFILWCTMWLMAAWRACRPGATLHVFSDWRQLPAMTDAVQAGGWLWRGIVPWNKTQATRPTLGRHRPQCEYVTFATKGPHSPYPGAPAMPGFYRYLPPRERYHITEKPIQLFRDMVQATPPGGLVLDPFTGSGAAIVGILAEGRRALALELSPQIAELAAGRVAAAADGITLADRAAGQEPLFAAERESEHDGQENAD